MIGAQHPFAVTRPLAENDVEIGKTVGADRGFRLFLPFGRKAAFLWQEGAKLAAIARDADDTDGRLVVRTIAQSDLFEGQRIARDLRAFPGRKRGDEFGAPGGYADNARNRDAEAAMGERRAPCRPRQAARAAEAFGKRRREEFDAPGDFRSRARNEPYGEGHAKGCEPGTVISDRERREAGDKCETCRCKQTLGGSLHVGTLPAEQRSERHEAEQRHEDRHKGVVEEGGPHRDLHAGQSIEQQRIERADENGGDSGGKQHVVHEQRGFAAQRRKRPPVFSIGARHA